MYVFLSNGLICISTEHKKLSCQERQRKIIIMVHENRINGGTAKISYNNAITINCVFNSLRFNNSPFQDNIFNSFNPISNSCGPPGELSEEVVT